MGMAHLRIMNTDKCTFSEGNNKKITYENLCQNR